MNRRGFMKRLGMAAASIMLPLQLTLGQSRLDVHSTRWLLWINDGSITNQALTDFRLAWQKVLDESVLKSTVFIPMRKHGKTEAYSYEIKARAQLVREARHGA